LAQPTISQHLKELKKIGLIQGTIDGVFKEINRVLKPGGHFSISDIVLIGTLPTKMSVGLKLKMIR
jgi:predicted methyltransferase